MNALLQRGCAIVWVNNHIPLFIWMQLLINAPMKEGTYHSKIFLNESFIFNSIQWRHNEHYSVSNHQPHDCLLNRLFGRRSKKISKFRVNGLCAGNSPMTGEIPAQMASKEENVSIWCRYHVVLRCCSTRAYSPVNTPDSISHFPPERVIVY